MPTGETIAPETHPLADIFPVMSDAEFADLKEDIKTNGLADPIILFEEKILDGRHRYRACRELSIEPRFVDWNGQGSPLSYVLGKNLHRRHLNETQRALLAARLQREFEAEARANMSKGGQGLADLPTLHTRDRAAEVARVSSRLAGSATVVLERGVPALVAAVERGAVKVSPAAAVAALDADEQERLVAEGPKAVRARATELRRAKAPDRRDERRHGRVDAGPAPPAASPVDGMSDPHRLDDFPLRNRIANPRVFDCRALAWRHLNQIHEQLLREYPDVARGEQDRTVLFDPMPLWIGRMDPGPDPSSWVVCPACDGAGADDGRRCWTCHGEGFLTRDVDPLESASG